MPLVRLSVRDVDASALDLALSHALTVWTADLRRGEPALWEQFAVEAHATRHTLRTTSAVAECRRLVLLGDIAGALRAVADVCERGEPALAGLGPMLRHYADAVLPGGSDAPPSARGTRLA